MKRHTTELEKHLLDIGLVLTSKFYCGKHSQKTDCYLYSGLMAFNNITLVNVDVYINQKRDMVRKILWKPTSLYEGLDCKYATYYGEMCKRIENKVLGKEDE